MRKSSITLLLAGVLAFTATPALAQGAESGAVPGLTEVLADGGVDGAFDRLQGSLEGNEAVSVVATVDHSANAASVGQELRPTRLALFGNPKLGTPLMQQSQTAGIDLPQKMLVREDSDGGLRVGYNSPEYLAARHGVSGGELQMIDGALSKLAAGAAGVAAANGDAAAITGDASGVQPGEGLITTRSAYGPEETFTRLRQAVEGNEKLSVITSLDHQANAESVGMDLRPTKLLVFGNPEAGTPLMQSAQTTGIDLPQKALVYEDAAGDTYLAYNDPYYVAERHGVTGADQQLAMISTALGSLATEATGVEGVGETPDTGGLPLVASLSAIAALLLAGSGVTGLLWLRSRRVGRVG
jgi:uncharacterized protein (DUF302 family)